MTVFQTPTYQVIISNLGWCFFVENSVETFKDVAKLNICEKKEKAIFIVKGKKKQALFSKRFVLNTFSKKQKELFWKLLVQKKSVASFGSRKKKEKQGFDVERFDLIAKLCSFCLRQSLLIAKNKTENTCL